MLSDLNIEISFAKLSGNTWTSISICTKPVDQPQPRVCIPDKSVQLFRKNVDSTFYTYKINIFSIFVFGDAIENSAQSKYVCKSPM